VVVVKKGQLSIFLKSFVNFQFGSVLFCYIIFFLQYSVSRIEFNNLNHVAVFYYSHSTYTDEYYSIIFFRNNVDF